MTTLRVARRSHWCTSKLTTWRVNLTILSLRICPLCSGDVTSLLWVCIDSEFAHLHLFANEHFLPVLYAPLQSVICIYFLYQILGWRFVRSFFVFSTVCHYLPQCIRGPRSLDYWITITWFLGATDAEESSSKNGKGASQRIDPAFQRGRTRRSIPRLMLACKVSPKVYLTSSQCTESSTYFGNSCECHTHDQDVWLGTTY